MVIQNIHLIEFAFAFACLKYTTASIESLLCLEQFFLSIFFHIEQSQSEVES